MKSLSRRITEAAERTARAETRLAASKERLVQNLGEFMRVCDGEGLADAQQPRRKDSVPTKAEAPKH